MRLDSRLEWFQGYEMDDKILTLNICRIIQYRYDTIPLNTEPYNVGALTRTKVVFTIWATES